MKLLLISLLLCAGLGSCAPGSIDLYDHSPPKEQRSDIVWKSDRLRPEPGMTLSRASKSEPGHVGQGEGVVQY